MDLFDPAKYKEVMDQIFGLSSPETMAAFYDQAVKLLQTYSTSAMGFMGPWTEAMQKNVKIFPQFAEGHPESFMNIFHNMFNTFDSTFGQVFHVPAVGKDREKVALLLRTFDDLAVNMAKNTEYQHAIYVTGITAMKMVIESIPEKIKSGEEIKSTNEFFDLWIDTNEKTYLPKLHKARKFVLEMLLIHHPLDYPVCDIAGECQLQDLAYQYGSAQSRFEAERSHEPESIAAPLVERNPNRCILCGKCVRVCYDHQGVGAINLLGRGFKSKVSPAFEETLA